MRRVLIASTRHVAHTFSTTSTQPLHLLKPWVSSVRWQSSQATEAAPPSPRLQLRPYQEDSIQSVLNYLDKGERRLGLSLATGSGKTVIFSHLLERIAPPKPNATQTLILAHRRELVEQAAKHCRNLYPDKIVEVEMGAQHASGLADVTIASVQSITSGERLLKYDPARFKLVVVDEAHHIVASGYLDTLRHFGLLERDPENGIALVGVSATFSRSDGLQLGKAIDHIVFHKDYIDMIEDRYLADAIFTTVQSKANLSDVKEVRGDFATGQLSSAVNNPESNAITIRAWMKKAKGRLSTLVFCVDLKHVAGLTDAFRQHGIDARSVSSNTKLRERRNRIEDFKEGKYPVLLNCGIFTEGTDIPNIDCIILARPTKSRNLLVQMLGRGLRKSEGKKNCHVLDMVSSLETGIVTTPTLFGLDPTELVSDADPKKLLQLKEKRDEEQKQREAEAAENPSWNSHVIANPQLKVTFTDYDNVQDLISDTSGERYIRAISPFAWVQVDQDRFVLSDKSGGYLTLKHVVTNGADHIVTLVQKLTDPTAKSPYMRPRQIASAPTFEGAVRAGDTYAKEHFTFQFVHKNAGWRRGPATEGQLSMLNKKRGEDEQLDAANVSKGAAADWITKIKHGAQGRFNKMVLKKKQVERKFEKEAVEKERKKKAQVKVGPVLE